MDLGNPTPQRQTVRRRRSDRYLQEEQAAAIQQPVAPRMAEPNAPPPAPKQTVTIQQPVAPRMAEPSAPPPAPKQTVTMRQPVAPRPDMQQQSVAPVQQATVPQQTRPMTPPPAPNQSAATMQPARWPQQPVGNTAYPQQTVSGVPQQALNNTIPPRHTHRVPASQPTQQMPQPQQPLGGTAYPQPQQPFSHAAYHPQPQRSLSNTIPPHQAAYGQQPSLGNAVSPQQPGHGWEGAGQPGLYGQPPAGWQQPYYGQQQGYEEKRPDAPVPAPLPDGQPQRIPDVISDAPPVKFSWQIIVVAAALVMVLVLGVLGIRKAVQEHSVRSYVSDYDAKFCEGVYVDGIHLGGMTQQEGIAAVTNQAQQRNSDWYVRLTYQGRTVVEMNAAQLGMRVDVADALRRAWEQGHSSSDPHERQEAMEKLLEEPYQDYTALPSGDTSVVDSVLEELRNKVYRAPQDAYLAEFDPDKTYPFTVVDEVAGMMLNTDDLKTRIYQMVSTMESGELEIEPESIAPNVTAAQIRESIALRADEYTEISTRSTEERNKNIKRAFELINGTILKPGDTFSFNTVVGRRTTANGFFPAVEYVYGKEEMGIGGGVCQASTSMYLAAVAANLQITKHTPHSMQVGYTTFGKDATVSWEGSRQVDFAFTNNTDGDIYIVASVQFDRTISKYSIARVRIYGPSLGQGVTYKLEAEEIEFIPRTEEIKKDTKGEYPELIYTDEQMVVSEGRDGHVTQSYRVKYQNGVEVERTRLYTDTYKAAPRVIYTGTLERWQ